MPGGIGIPPSHTGAGRALFALLGSIFLALAPSSFAAAPPAAKADTVQLRKANHPDGGRLVFDTPSNATYDVTRNGDLLTITFADTVALSGSPAAARNVLSIQTDAAHAALVAAAGAPSRATRSGPPVIDDFEPAPTSTASTGRQPTRPPLPVPTQSATRATPHRPWSKGTSDTPGGAVKPASTEPASPPVHQAPLQARSQPTAVLTVDPPQAPIQSLTAATLQPVSSESAPAAAAPVPSPQPVPAIAGGPVALLARRAIPPVGVQGPAFAVPFPPTVGAALFRHGVSTFVVFDERRPIDLAALRVDPVFGSAGVQLLPNGTLIRLHPPLGITPVLLQTPQGWTIALLSAPPRVTPIALDITPEQINFPATQPSDIVAVADPDSGATWLVGTQRQPGQGLAIRRRTPEFTLLATGQGVVVEPLADSIALRVVPSGFTLTGKQTGLAVSPQPAMADVLSAAARLTRRFDFPTMPTEALVQQMTRQVRAAATAPPQSRGPKRRAAAMTMIALGLTAEAQALLQIVVEQDPKEAASPETAGLRGIAAVLANRPEEAGGLADPRLTGTDDVALWRAVRLAMMDDGSSEAASVFAATAPLAFAYPPEIRDHILALVLETMVQGGERLAAAKLLAQRPKDHRLAFARALVAQANGDTEAALHLLDALADDRDQWNRARAVWRAVELRLASQQIDARQAAESLDKLRYVWRGDRRDLAMRERLAELLSQSGSWRPALALLREAQSDFPEQAADLRSRLQATFASLLNDDAAEKLPPLDLIALMDENADLLPATPEGDAMKLRLADRLAALDLPKRADPLLEKLMQAAPPGEGRAGLGTKLARLRLRENDTDGAISALGASSGADLPPTLFEARALLAARIYGQRNDTQAALAALAPLDSATADEARASVLEQANDWPAAEQALTNYVARTVPESGDIDDNNRRALLRLATAAARAEDSVGLAALRARQEQRVGSGPLADMFRLLTADPVRGTADLARSKREVGLARGLQSGLRAFQPVTATR